ncbi:MAG: nucleoside monophosphate kinase [Holosporales bacterium]|jgi:adenylate kinase|nr:nucleoside monophosphate kinase [Holosporales bacterium]
MSKEHLNKEEAPGGVSIVHPPVNEAGDVAVRGEHKAVILIGAPGCGKGTLTSSFESMLGFSVFSSGNALRAEIASGSSLGIQAQSLCDKGLLVPDEMVLEMVSKFISENKKGKAIFDGFPRTVRQAEALSPLLADWNTLVFHLRVDESVAASRMLGRYACKTCGTLYNEKTVMPKVSGVCDVCGRDDFVRRNDDNEDAILTRLRVYNESTAPVLDYYAARGELYTVDASKAPNLVSGDVWQVIFG